MTAAGPPTDFLSRLAARALGLGPASGPRIPSIFEPTSAPAAALDLVEEAGGDPSQPSAPLTGPEPTMAAIVSAPTAPFAPPPGSVRARAAALVQPVAAAATGARHEQPGAVDRHSSSPQSRHESAAASPLPGTAVPGKPLLADAASARADLRPAPAAGPATAPRRNPTPALPPSDRSLTLAMPLAIPFAPPDRPLPSLPTRDSAAPLFARRDRRSAFSSGAAPAEGPPVNITIGRVEVRAAVPAAAPRRAAPAPRGEPPQSLADYLKRRDRAP